jgi:hypothetical protein
MLADGKNSRHSKKRNGVHLQLVETRAMGPELTNRRWIGDEMRSVHFPRAASRKFANNGGSPELAGEAIVVHLHLGEMPVQLLSFSLPAILC